MLSESASDAVQVNFIRRTVFERLNTGGQQLNGQELRNSLYSGPLNDLLLELAGSPIFNDLWGIPRYQDHYKKQEGFISSELAENKLFRRMTDCEIILRFFAFRRPSAIRGSVKNILDNCMEENREAGPEQIQKWRTTFMESLNLAQQIFGTRTFQVKDPKGDWKHSQPLFDAVMIAAEVHFASKNKLVASRAKLTKDLNDILADPDTYEIVIGRPNTAQAIKDRISTIGNLFKKYS